MHILIFGDSIAQGFHDDEKGGWATRLFASCVKDSRISNYEKHVTVFNLGVSGDRSSDLAKRFDVEFSARQDSDLVTLFAVGTNDSARNVNTQENRCALGDFMSNMRSMIKKAQEKGRVVLVGLPGLDESILTPIPWFREYSHLQKDRAAYDAVLQELSAELECVYIKTHDIFDGQTNDLLTDGLHPNAEGHRLMYERVKAELEAEGILK